MAALGAVVVVASVPRGGWYWLAGAAMALIGAAAWSRVAWREWLRRLLWVEPFALGVAVLALFQPEGGVLFFTMLAKSTLCIATVLLLTLTTPFHEVLGVLARWRVPGLLLTTMALAHRYLFVLRAEAERMRRARQSRTLARGRWVWWAHMGDVAGQLFVRTTARAERIHAAMCARGWKP